MGEFKMPTVRIGNVPKEHGVLGLGCWAFGQSYWAGQEDADSLAAMAAAVEAGMNHFDTAEGYGKGHSEQLVGKFLAAAPDTVFVATKAFPGELDAAAAEAQVDIARGRLGIDTIDLFYIHWPREGEDMRPVMQGLESARAKGKIGAVGVSNFSVEQMRQVCEVGAIDAHQLCYNLLWRHPEREVIPFCRENDIAVVTYSSIAQGILTGKFPRAPEFPDGDGRAKMLLFDSDVWPRVYEGVERLKEIAAQVNRPLVDLAIRWVAAQRGVTSILVGVRNAEQVRRNAAAMAGDVPDEALRRMTDISDEVVRHVPDVGNLFRFYP